MAPSQSNAKALFIVEGAKREVEFVKKLTKFAGIQMEVFSVCANIHMLYCALKKYDFNFNIVDALLELKGVSDADKEMLRKQRVFAFVYLIFDLDLQHYDLSKKENVKRGLKEVREMVEYFGDETDPTVGKMYINYPSVESFRDCKDFFDDTYRDARIRYDQGVRYKSIVGRRGLKLPFSCYTKENFSDLALMNIFKANYLSTGRWEKPSYAEYLLHANQTEMIKQETGLILTEGAIAVLNSGFLIWIDYFGNSKGFYDSLSRSQK